MKLSGRLLTLRLRQTCSAQAARVDPHSLLLVVWAALASGAWAGELTLPAHAQTAQRDHPSLWAGEERTLRWDATKTAVVICDMWDQHTCPASAARVAEMTPRMNEVIKIARAQGVFIIHCPSDTMRFYQETPQRRLAQAAPPVIPKVPLARWTPLDLTKEAALPIDDTDGGCDCERTWKQGDPYPWTRQIATLEVMEGDAITDSAEAYYLLEQRGIENVIVMGVHLNMCVLGRPFAIRQMVAQGKNVVLMRDLTDTMYNPARPPFVSHFQGTRLMLDHVERYWCPTVTSAAFLGGEPFRFRGDTETLTNFRAPDHPAASSVH